MARGVYDEAMRFVASLFLAARRSEAIRQSFILVMGTTLTGLIMAVAMILASRSLGPTKFGIFSVSVAIMGLLSKGTDLGFNQLIPRLMNKWHRHPDKAQEFLAHVVYWKLRLFFVTAVAGIVSIPLLVRLFNYPHVDMVLWAVVGALIMGFYEYVYLLLAAKHDFIPASIMSVAQAILKAAGFGFMFLLAAGAVNGIAAVYYVAPLLSAGFIAWKARDWMWVDPALAGKEVKTEINSFVWHALIGVLAMTLILNLDVLLVQRYLNSYETGLYSGATRIAAFVGFATTSIGGVLNNRVSRYHDRPTLVKYLIKSSSLLVLSALGFLVFLPLARLSLVWTIGPEYLGGLPALIILVFNAFLSLAIVPYISFFYSVDHPRFFSIGGILQVAIIVLGNWLFLPSFGIQAAAWTKVTATAAFGLFTAAYIWYALRRFPRKARVEKA